MKKFKPYYDKIEIEPIREATFMPTQDDKFVEMGKVVSTGSKVKFFKKGDVVYFLAYGCDKTPEVEGVQHYVVTDDPRFILGKA